MKITFQPGFTVGVWDLEAKERADLSGFTDVTVTVVRPDGSVVEREAFVTSDPGRIEIKWHPQDLSMKGVYVGDVSALNPSGERENLRGAFKLGVSGGEVT